MNISTKAISQKKYFLSCILIVLNASLFISYSASAKNLTVQKEVDKVQPSLIEMDLTDAPTHEMLIASGQLGGILSPTGPVLEKHKSRFPQLLGASANSHLQTFDFDKSERMAFGEAIQNWNKHEYKKAYQQFDQFAKTYPNSSWKSEAILHMSCEARFNGRYTEAEQLFNRVISDNKDNPYQGAQMIRAKAISRLAVLRVMENNPQAARELFTELKEIAPDWRLRTYASQWLRRIGAQERDMANLLSCGTEALAAVLTRDGRHQEAEQVLQIKPSEKGFSIDQLTTMALNHGYNARAVNLSIEDIKHSQLPMILQVSRSASGGSGHYWVLEELAQDGTVVVYDPQMSRRFTQTTSELAREWQGNAIAFTETPGRLLTALESQQIFGGCCGVQRPESDLGPPDAPDEQPNQPDTPPANAPDAPEPDVPNDPNNDCKNPKGAPVWSVNMLNMNMYVQDIPLWYQPALGPEVKIDLSYNSQSAIAQNEPFGAKWMFNYASYLVIDPGNTVTLFNSNGSRSTYEPLYTTEGGERVISSFRDQSGRTDSLLKISDTHYEMHFDNGSKILYQVPSNTAALQLFITKIVDAYGYALTFEYDAQARMQEIIDAEGRRTQLFYNPENLVTRVEDPFNRSATFNYDNQRNLISITDMQGYTTKLGYDKDRYMSLIEDAKGRTTFYTEPSGGSNNSNGYPPPGSAMWDNYRITITNPNGDKEEYHYNGYHGVSWYVAPGDYIEYSGNNNNTKAPKIVYDFEPGRNLVRQITYPNGATFSYYKYDSSGRIIQQINQLGEIQRFTYNDKGQLVTVTNAMDEVTTYSYHPNGIDIKSITSPSGTINYQYDSNHQITRQDANNGQITQFSYLANGKLETVTNALNQVTQYLYNDKHRLHSIKVEGKTIATYEYDNIGRKIAETDLHGRKTTYAYNNINTLVKITYPGGRTISREYNTCPRMLEAETLPGDRRYKYEYDAAKQLISETDPLQGKVSYERDKNGNITTLIDKNQNRTSYKHNSVNQKTELTYADGTALKTTYDKGRVTSINNGRGL